MIDLDALVMECPDVTAIEVTRWVARGWVRPRDGGKDWEFAEVDVARVRLIRDLTRDMALTEEAVPVVLSLLDQVYALRAHLGRVGRALQALPEDERRSLLDRLAG